MIKPT